MRYRLGLFGAAELTEREVREVLASMRVSSVIEQLDTRFFDVSLKGSELSCTPTDPKLAALVQALFDVPSPSLAVRSPCVLVPGARNPDYQREREVPGVEGWTFRALDAVVAELDALESASALSGLRRASNLGIAVVFGERVGLDDDLEEDDIEELELDP